MSNFGIIKTEPVTLEKLRAEAAKRQPVTKGKYLRSTITATEMAALVARSKKAKQ